MYLDVNACSYKSVLEQNDLAPVKAHRGVAAQCLALHYGLCGDSSHSRWHACRGLSD